MQINLHVQLHHTSNDNCPDQTVQGHDETEEERVIVPPDASSKPDTMVIKLGHTVVTQIAMG